MYFKIINYPQLNMECPLTMDFSARKFNPSTAGPECEWPVVTYNAGHVQGKMKIKINVFTVHEISICRMSFTLELCVYSYLFLRLVLRKRKFNLFD